MGCLSADQVDQDDEDDEDDDFDADDDSRGGEAEDEDPEDPEDDGETWQVSRRGAIPLKDSSCLTSGIELPRLAPDYQPSYGWTDSAGTASRRLLSSQAPITG